MKKVTLLISILSCLFITLNAQFKVEDLQKVPSSEILQYQKGAYLEIWDSTITVKQIPIPRFLRLKKPVAHIPNLQTTPFTIYYSPTGIQEYYLLHKGYCRGGLHISIPIARHGVFFVLIQNDPNRPSFLQIDARTNDLKIRFKREFQELEIRN